MSADPVRPQMFGDTDAQVATTDLDAEYEIIGELGRGASAVVYRARDRELGRDVAIKVIRPKFGDDDEAVARLAREARTVAQLQHPNIVTIYSVRRIRDGGLALVMQLVPGRTLRDLLNERRMLSFERADRVLRDVAAALAHAHRRGVVHRDVKPENIFIDETTGHALLSDFGVARSLEAESQLTATGTAIGTPAYMSPEQIDGTALDGRSDLYSLGLVGWEMLTGRRPWEGEGLYSVIYKQKREELQPIDELRPDTPDRLIYLVEGAMRKRVADRWFSAEEFLDLATTIAPAGGWERWHAERRKRIRSRVYTAARERGDSVVSAALETVRFRRDAVATPPRRGAPAGQPTQDGTAAPSRDAATAEPRRTDPDTFSTDRDAEPDVFGRRRSLVPVLAVITITLAGVVGAARLMRGRVEPPTSRPSTTFADNGGVEVPVARRPPLPNVATPVDAATQPDSTPPNIGAASGADTAPDRPAVPAGAAAPSDRDTNLAVEPPSRRAEPSPDKRERPRSPVESERTTAPPVAASSTTAPAPAPVGGASGRVPTSPPPPVPMVTAVTTVSFPAERGIVAAGGRHSCALNDAGAAVCWGANDQGQLGDGTLEDRAGPAPVAGGLTFTQLSAGASHTCGITREGDAYCWGTNERGQLGDATTLQRDTPVRVGASGPFRVVRAGFSHSCALSRGGEVSCWGSNAYGQLGTGGGLTSARPADVAGGLRFGAVAVGWNHTCGITLDGTMYCWGSNTAGQLGDGSRDDRRVPTRVMADARFVAVAAGNQHTCAVTTVGEVYCWGRNNYGQLGTGAGDRVQPTRVGAEGNFVGITAGAVHSCARTSSGQLFCWGRNNYGQLGDGTTSDRTSPVRVPGMPPIAVVQASGAHTCAATSGGDSYCWGYNVEGQVGDGTRNHRARPVRVSAPAR